MTRKKKRLQSRMTAREIAAMKHCITRARQRFHLTLDENGYRRMVRKIKSGEAEFIHRQSHTRTFHTIEIENKQMVAVYLPPKKGKRGVIRTLLTVEQANETLYGETNA